MKQGVNILIISYLLILNCLGCQPNSNQKFRKQPVEGYCKSIFINYFEDPSNEKRYHPPKMYFNLKLINNSQEDVILTSDNHNIAGVEQSNLLVIFDKDTLGLYAYYKADVFRLKAQETIEYTFETSIQELKSKFKLSGYRVFL